MTIHHDKLAYGKLEKTCGEMSDEEILAMLAELDKPQRDEKGEEKIKGAEAEKRCGKK